MEFNLTDLQRALESDAFVPCFQPIVELRSGKLAGFEVLARWQHPNRGLILPEHFISMAEENDLIGQLTQQVLNKAFQAGPALPPPLFLAINISPVQLRHLSLPSLIQDMADRTGFPLQQLIVEITESALVNNLDFARRISAELIAMGCKLSLDDFGTGYSSLRHLQALPFSKLKVDGTFVQSMTERRESRKIVAAVVGLGHSIGMETVAEGVETEQQADMLLWLGCELGQGWLFGRPMPADRLPEMVAAERRPASCSMPAEMNGSVSCLEALPEQRLAQLQAIYDGAPVGLAFLDRNLRYVSLNQRLADLNGASVADHLGKTVPEMVPALFPSIQPFLWRALMGEAIADVEISRPSPKPGLPDLTIHVSYQPAFDEAHEVIGVSIAVIDISQSKRAQEILRQSEDEFRNLFELGPHLQWILDSEGNLLDISSRWVQLTGMTREQTQRLGWVDALHPDDVAPTMKALKAALRSGKPVDIEHRVKTADKKWKRLRARGMPLHSPSGEILRLYGSCEEIDECSKLEETLP
jgi:PAS domain S-box-containing protein